MSIDGISLETDRLRIVPMTFEFVTKLLAGDESAYADIGAVKTESWPEKADIWDILPMMLEGLSDQTDLDGFHGAWIFIEKATHSVVGDGGY